MELPSGWWKENDCSIAGLNEKDFEKVKDLRKASGDVMSHQVNWNPLSWKRQGLEMFKPQISKFASECRQVKIQHVISRQDILTLSESFEDVFIGAMIFGYGPVGYGPSRIGRVINENPDLIEKEIST